MIHLTPRQTQIVDLLRQGKILKQIASELGISMMTVKAHKSRLHDLFGVHGTVQLLAAIDRQKADEEAAGQLSAIELPNA